MIRYHKNPRSTKSIITVNGRQYPAKYIGKGQYSKVYRVGDRVVYYTRGDCAKEVLAMFQYNRMAHLPELIRHENITTVRGVWYVFSSPYYRNVTTKNSSAYRIMKNLISLTNQFNSEIFGSNIKGLERMQAFEVYVRGSVPRSISKALQEIVNISSNCGGDVGFDFHKKNFGVNEYGTLIFRDPVYVYT